MTTILFTGSSGFLGRHLLPELLRLPVRIIAPVRPASLTALALHPNLELIPVEDLFSLSDSDYGSLTCQADILLHTAWNPCTYDYAYQEENLKCLCGSINLARAFIKSGGKRVVGIGTCAEYDPQYGYMRPHTPTKPSTLYARSKVALSSVLETFSAAQDCDFLWLRLFSLYTEQPDPRDYPPRLSPYLHESLAKGNAVTLSSGKQIRDFIEVGEAARQIALITHSSQVGYANICTGKGLTVRCFSEKIADIYGRRDLLHFNPDLDRNDEAQFIVGEPYAF